MKNLIAFFVGLLVTSALIVVYLFASVDAQTPTPLETTLRQEIANLRNLVQQQAAQVQTLQKQLQSQQQQGNDVRTKAFYATTFRQLKKDAGPPCQDAGGKLWVMVSQSTPQVVQISCEFK